MKKLAGIGLAAVALVVALGGASPVLRTEPRFPVPGEGRRTKQWVLEDYLAWKVDRFVWYSEVYDRESYIRSGWAAALRAAILAASAGGAVGECPKSLDELLASRFLPFVPVDRFPQTALRGGFLKGAELTPEAKQRLASPHQPANEEAILRDFGEGTILFREGRDHGATVVIVYQGHSDRTGPFKPLLSTVSCLQPSRLPPVDENGALWARLADSLFEFVAAYTAFTGRPPETIRDVDGTVGQWNGKAWSDPEVGPVLKTLSERMLSLMKEKVPLRPALGEFEPLRG